MTSWETKPEVLGCEIGTVGMTITLPPAKLLSAPVARLPSIVLKCRVAVVNREVVARLRSSSARQFFRPSHAQPITEYGHVSRGGTA